MKKSIIIIIILIALALLSFAAFHNRYRITVGGATDLVISCPTTARAGQTVTVETRCVTDGWVEVSVTNTDVTAVQEDLFQFVMPKHDVDVRVRFAYEE